MPTESEMGFSNLEFTMEFNGILLRLTWPNSHSSDDSGAYSDLSTIDPTSKSSVELMAIG